MEPVKSFLSVLALFAAASAIAAPNDFEIKLETKCLSKERSSTSIEKISREQWAYNVTVEDKSAKDHAGLEIKYILFASDVKPGSRAAPTLVRKNGSTTVDIKSREKKSFTTEPMDITKSQLAGGVTWGSGARPRANETLEGIWLRIYKDGELLNETVRPQNLATRQTWEKK
jgi:hypothetical protein